jgi:hypothetical protein
MVFRRGLKLQSKMPLIIHVILDAGQLRYDSRRLKKRDSSLRFRMTKNSLLMAHWYYILRGHWGVIGAYRAPAVSRNSRVRLSRAA